MIGKIGISQFKNIAKNDNTEKTKGRKEENMPVSHEKKIEHLKEEIESGSYALDLRKTASKMAKELKPK